MSGYAGIHAMQADWETPHVVAFFHADHLGYPIEGGQLSPDAMWYAVPVGERFTEVSFNVYWFARGLRIYSSIDDTELSFNLSDYYELLNRVPGIPETAWTYEAVGWIDNESLVMGQLLFRPFEDEVEVAGFSVGESTFTDLAIAPDWTRAFGYIRSGAGYEGIFDPAAEDIVIAPLQAEAVAWRPDSSGFIAEQVSEAEDQLSLFSRDGEFIERLYIADKWCLDISRPVAGRNELGWSPTNRYFAFVHDLAYPKSTELVLLDMTDRIAINTCLNSVAQPVWSPDGTQVALLVPASEDLHVVILDMESWTAYVVARQSGLSGVLKPDMLAWRPAAIEEKIHPLASSHSNGDE